ncbi:uncharacterized protein LOC143449661 isoform X4 [Clavelina lepadiformis]|uniref:uncharacterized protein LOC143449661 isoform X4 n=1 Tax=Clavelina lepadiformis TaxID=159417 RepID=UPI00404139C2
MEEKQCSSKNFSQTTSRHHYQDLSSDTDSDIPSTSKFQRKSRRHRRHFSDSDSDLSSVSWERSRQHLRDISSDSDSYKSREHRKKSKCHHRHLRDIDSDLSSSSYTSQSEMKQHQGFFGESPGSRRSREKSRHHRQVVSSDADSDKSRKQQRKSRYLHQGYSSDLTSDSSPKLFRKSRRQRQHFSSYSSGNRKRNKNVDTKASSSSVMSRNIKRSSAGRIIRTCPYCKKTYVNVSNHCKKHPDIPKENLLYDSFAKKMKKAGYEQFAGYFCTLCGRSVLGIESHIKHKHKEIILKSEEFNKICEESKVKKSDLQFYLTRYQTTLQTMGIGKRNECSEAEARRYVQQVRTLTSGLEDIKYPTKIYQTLCQQISGEGHDSTRYAYLATLNNFLQFMQIEFGDIQKTEIEKLSKYVNQWLQRQRQKKEKRERFVKDNSIKKLRKHSFPGQKIKAYERATEKEAAAIRCKTLGSLTKQEITFVCGDIFARIICRLGCRSSTITGIKRKEVEDHEVMDSGFYSILVADQKEKTRHACLVLSPEEFEDVKKTSDHVWSFLQALPTLNDRVFPSLSGSNLKGRMSSAAFNTIYKKISRKCFKTPVNVTETRKLITREISGKPRQIKEAIARAEGHTLGVADTFYDVTHPSEIVQTARIYLEEIAMKTVSESGVKSNTGAVAGSQTQKAAEPVPNVTDKSDCQIGAVTGSQTQEAAEPVPNVTDKSDCQIGAVTGSQTQEPAEPVPNVTDKSDCQIGAVTGRQAQEESGPTIGVAISFSEANVIRVKFTYDRIILDIFRPADIRFASGGDVQSLADIKMGEKCLARWPPDKQFYLATRVDPSFCTPKKRREGTYYSDSDTSPQKKVQLPVTAKRRRKKITFTNFEYA